MKQYFFAADILLPDFSKHDGTKWAVIACDQHTGEPEYWHAAEALVGADPSTLAMILREAYLEQTEERIPVINQTMDRYLTEVLREHKDSMIYLERTLANGTVRRGIVGCIDLEQYDYSRGAASLIRATEGTVLERIPPRVAIRRGASVELPHVMVLVDDPMKTVVEPIANACGALDLAYDFDLMLDGGHVKGYWIDSDRQTALNGALEALITPQQMKARYGEEYAPLLFAVGDGNHSLASAKAAYEEVKAALGDKAADHPARYALVEIVNLHDEALDFDPIYRVMFDVSPAAVLEALREYAGHLDGAERPQKVDYVHAGGTGSLVFRHPTQQLTVGTIQTFIDSYLASHPEASVDYIHGVEVTEALARRENAIGFLFDGMEKEQLFKTVICDGALPRKTFSMGHAADKRYYLECRKIK